ncbi:MAG: BrnA antitoxin family protein [Rhodoferax sp.]
MPKLKLGTIQPTPEEDVIITAAAMSDPDAVPLTDAQWKAVRPMVRMGRPPSVTPLKVPTTIRFDADVLAGVKATGKGWQTRVNDAMREWLRSRSQV